MGVGQRPHCGSREGRKGLVVHGKGKFEAKMNLIIKAVP